MRYERARLPIRRFRRSAPPVQSRAPPFAIYRSHLPAHRDGSAHRPGGVGARYRERAGLKALV
jgi:hypothetical protein